MTEQERINQQLQRQIDAQNSRIDNTLAKVDMLVSEMRDFKTEMRDRDNQRAAEIMEMRQRHDVAFAKLDAKIDNIGNHVRNLSVATIIGVATIAITVVYSIVTH